MKKIEPQKLHVNPALANDRWVEARLVYLKAFCDGPAERSFWQSAASAYVAFRRSPSSARRYTTWRELQFLAAWISRREQGENKP
jgi:hypothetical protein